MHTQQVSPQTVLVASCMRSLVSKRWLVSGSGICYLYFLCVLLHFFSLPISLYHLPHLPLGELYILHLNYHWFPTWCKAVPCSWAVYLIPLPWPFFTQEVLGTFSGLHNSGQLPVVISGLFMGPGNLRKKWWRKNLLEVKSNLIAGTWHIYRGITFI